jgi:hypothetical protein
LKSEPKFYRDRRYRGSDDDDAGPQSICGKIGTNDSGSVIQVTFQRQHVSQVTRRLPALIFGSPADLKSFPSNHRNYHFLPRAAA